MTKQNQLGTRFSLKFSLSSAFIGIALLTAMLLGFANYWNIRSYVRNDIRDKMQSTIAISALIISAESHDRLQSLEDEEKSEYTAIRKQLRDIRSRFSEIKNIYTFRKDATGQVQFVVDAETDPEEVGHLGDVYEDETPALKAAFQTPYGIHVEEDFSTDKWGTWLSAFAPILRPDGSLAGVLGMDMSAEKILAYEREFLLVVLGISLSVCLFVVGLLRSLSQQSIDLFSWGYG